MVNLSKESMKKIKVVTSVVQFFFHGGEGFGTDNVRLLKLCPSCPRASDRYFTHGLEALGTHDLESGDQLGIENKRWSQK